MLLFIVKKVISELLNPFFVILLLLLVGLFFLWLTKKQKFGKNLVSLGVILIFIFGSNTVSNIFVIPLEDKYPKYESIEEHVKYVVVLGGGYGYDKQLPIASRLSVASLFRLTEGIAVYKDNPDSKLIFTGYGGSKTAKSYCCRDGRYCYSIRCTGTGYCHSTHTERYKRRGCCGKVYNKE